MADLLILGLLAAGGLVVLVLLALILKSLAKRREGAEGEVIASSGPVSDKAPEEAADAVTSAPPKDEPEPQRLARMEKELAEREAKAKAERMKELQDREKVIRKRETEQPKEQNLEPEQPKDELLEERKRILELIKKTEDRYANGEMEERSFKRILSDYQQQIIEIDIQLRKKRH